jgi:hypothetical protein
MVFNPRYPITNPCKEIFLNDMRIREVDIIDKNAIVDGEKWYTVITGHEAARWIRSQDNELWYEAQGAFSSSVFDIHHELLLFIKLKWPA